MAGKATYGTEPDAMTLLRQASRWGAAWPTNLLSAPECIALMAALLALVKSRGARLATVAKGLRSVVEPLNVVEGVQQAIHRTKDLASEAIRAAEQLNTMVLLLRSEAVAVTGGDAAKAKDQFLVWWGQLGDALHGFAGDVVPQAAEEQLPMMLREMVHQMAQSLAQPVMVMTGDQGGPLAAFTGGGGGTGGGEGGGKELSALQKGIKGATDFVTETIPGGRVVNTGVEALGGKSAGDYAVQGAEALGVK